MIKKVKRIAFLGGAGWAENSKVFKEAYEVAKVLAQNGYLIVNGGGPGVMRASTLGAKSVEDNLVVAVTYHPAKRKKNYEGIDPKNPFDLEIMTLDYFDRTKVMLQNSDMHIVFNGGTGTLSELGMTWASSRIHEEDRKPIVLFGDFWKEILTVVDKHMLIRPGEDKLLKICNSPQEVLDYIEKWNNHGKKAELKTII